MEFTIDKAEVEEVIYSSDESDVSDNNESDPLSEYSDYEENSESFCRKFDNREQFHTFKNQIKSTVQEHQRRTSDYYGDNDLPEMFSLIMLNLTILNALRKEQIIKKKLSSVLTINQSRITFFILWFMILCLKKQKIDLILISLKKF